MRNILVCAVAVALAATLIGAAAVAQQAADVTVQGTRIPNKKTVGHKMTGIPIEEISLSYAVSAAGLDLTSHAGAMAFEKRVQDAAMTVCKELGKQYPDSTPNDADCAKAATDKAMVKVRELESAAAKK
jgi:UrcA family protein